MKKLLSVKEIIFLASSIIVRCLLGILIGAWFFPNVYDDLLMFQYSFFGYHFRNPDYLSLVKTMSYPFFLFCVKLSHIPITFWMSLFWCIAALVCFFMARKIVKNKIVSYIVYLYILFLPQAFEYWCGTRLYRNSIIGPFVIVIFAMLLMLLWNSIAKEKQNPVWFVLLGILFSFTFYIKEDGIWLLACLALWLVAGVWISVKSEEGKKRLKALFYLIPIAVFFLSTLCYKGVNYAVFGVFETNTRTSSSPGEFCELIYRIDSPNRTVGIWAPEDAIEKAFEASPTLAAHPELLEKIKTSAHLNGDIKENPIKGDHLGWVLRIELKDCPDIVGEEWDERKLCAFFDQVNAELKDAFRSGKLQKQKNRIQLLHSVGGYTGEEILGLAPIVREGFEGAVWLIGYTPGIMDTNGVREIEYYESAVGDVRNAVNIPSLDTGKAGNTTNAGASSVLNVITYVIWWIYRVINTVLFVMLAVHTVAGLVNIGGLVKKAKAGEKMPLYLYVSSVVLFLIAFAYAFAIAWFSAFIFEGGIDRTILNFYDIALPPLLAMAYITMVPGVVANIGKAAGKTQGNQKSEK